MEHKSGLKIAVIGSGVAGIVSAYLLQQKHDVTIFEKNDYCGGHTHTIVIDDSPDAGTPVDTGFIVLNDRTYPLLNKFLSQLGVAIRPTDMSFSYLNPTTGLSYASRNLNTIFADRTNIIRPSFWRLLTGILQFNYKTQKNLYLGLLKGITLGQYLQRENFSRSLIREYLIPMAAAIWSTPDIQMMDFPAESFARFFENHGLLSVTDQPQWYYVHGGSRTYVTAFLKNFTGRVSMQHGVAIVRRNPESVVVSTMDGDDETFDRVVIATHADEAYALLADPSEDEIRLLSPWQYTKNYTVLHTDTSLLPRNPRAWASWNYLSDSDNDENAHVTVTYHMNRLQHLAAKREYCVTLNPVRPIPAEHIIQDTVYTHPMYTFEALATQDKLPALNGRNNTYFCGSYFGYGFHEDAVRSAVDVAGRFGIEL